MSCHAAQSLARPGPCCDWRSEPSRPGPGSAPGEPMGAVADFASELVSGAPMGAVAGFASEPESGARWAQWRVLPCRHGLGGGRRRFDDRCPVRRDPPIGPVALVQAENAVDESHSELIRHDGSPGVLGLPSSIPGESCSPQNGWFSSAHRWLVLMRPLTSSRLTALSLKAHRSSGGCSRFGVKRLLHPALCRIAGIMGRKGVTEQG